MVLFPRQGEAYQVDAAAVTPVVRLGRQAEFRGEGGFGHKKFLIDFRLNGNKKNIAHFANVGLALDPALRP